MPVANAAFTVDATDHDDRQSGSLALLHLETFRTDGPSGMWGTVAGSGTGEPAGIGGTATIDLPDGSHTSRLDYSLA